jgi:hypothetical protein
MPVPIRLTCPNGHLLQTADELAGKKVRCSVCQVIVDVPLPNPVERMDDLEVLDDELVEATAPVESSAAITRKPERMSRTEVDEDNDREEDDENDDRPSPSRRFSSEHQRRLKRLRSKERVEAGQFQMVRVGLRLHAIRVMCYLIGLILLGVHGGIQRYLRVAATMEVIQKRDVDERVKVVDSAAEASAAVTALFVFMCVFLFFVAPLLGLTGSVFCCWVPVKSRARHFIVASLILDAIPFVLGILGMVLGSLRSGTAGSQSAGMALQLGATLSGLAAFILLMLFMRAVARYRDDDGTADESVQLLISFVVAIVGGGIALFLVAAFFLKATGGMVPAILVFLAFAWVMVLFSFLVRLFNLVQTVRALVQ